MFESKPNQYSQEEMDQMKASRMQSDADLLRNGASYTNDNLEPTLSQKEEIDTTHSEEIFKSTPEHAVFAERIHLLTELGIALGIVYGKDAYDFKRGGQIRANIVNLMAALEMQLPASREEGEILLAQVKAKANLLFMIDKLVATSPNLRIGSTVSILRSSGEIEPGWQIRYLLPDGSANVTNESIGKQKDVDIAELARINPA